MNRQTEAERLRILPRYVVFQHGWWAIERILRAKLSDREVVPPLAPFCAEGEIGTWKGIRLACYPGDVRENRLIPILEQERVETVFSIGLAGSISPTLRRGDLVAPTASVRNDGLTDLWADAKMPAVADARALIALNEAARRQGVPIEHGIFLTTQSMYRQPESLMPWKELGVVAVQMEIAPYFLLPHLFGKRAAGLYVISDHPLEGDRIWRTGIRRDETLLAAYERAAEIVLDAIHLLDGETTASS